MRTCLCEGMRQVMDDLFDSLTRSSYVCSWQERNVLHRQRHQLTEEQAKKKPRLQKPEESVYSQNKIITIDL